MAILKPVDTAEAPATLQRFSRDHLDDLPNNKKVIFVAGRLAEMRRSSEREGFPAIIWTVQRAEDNDGNVAQERCALHKFQDLVSAVQSKIQVQQNQIWLRCLLAFTQPGKKSVGVLNVERMVNGNDLMQVFEGDLSDDSKGFLILGLRMDCWCQHHLPNTWSML